MAGALAGGLAGLVNRIVRDAGEWQVGGDWGRSHEGLVPRGVHFGAMGYSRLVDTGL